MREDSAATLAGAAAAIDQLGLRPQEVFAGSGKVARGPRQWRGVETGLNQCKCNIGDRFGKARAAPMRVAAQMLARLYLSLDLLSK